MCFNWFKKIIINQSKFHYTIKELLQRLFSPVSSSFTTAFIGSAAKFNIDFVKNRCKLFTTVLIEQPLQNTIYSGSYRIIAAKYNLQRFL
jgi:hypothetical protein